MTEDGVTHEIKKVIATWSAHLYTNCPYCNQLIDLISEVPNYMDDWAKFFGILENKEKINVEVECPHCNLIFIVENVEW
jgi:DNA-directed RNA polymerase subunit RPC12/RpoP